MKRRPFSYLLFGISFLWIQGCITIDESYTFKKNGSGTMAYTIDMTEMGEMLDSMSDMVGDEEGEKDDDSPDLGALMDSDGDMKFLNSKDELEKIAGVSKVKVLEEKYKGTISFAFKNIEALNAALNVIQPDTTGQSHTFFTLNDGVLKRMHNKRSEMSSDLQDDDDDEMGAGFLKAMKYTISVKSKVVKAISSDSEASITQVNKKEGQSGIEYEADLRGSEHLGPTVRPEQALMRMNLPCASPVGKEYFCLRIMNQTGKKFLLEKAIRLAAKVHKGQVDRFNNPYILHVMRVMMRGHDNEEKILGALHDVLERSDLTEEDIRQRGFSERVVNALTHISRLEKETYEEYIDRVLEDSLAARVKLHDLADKMDVSKAYELNDSDIKRFNRQLAAYRKLDKMVRRARARMVIGQ